MKKILVLFAALILAITGLVPVCAASDAIPAIESEAACLMDAKTGQILFQKNMAEQLYPASITKIMTVLLGLENGNLNDTVTMSREAVFSIERGSSHIALDTGEQITLEQALMAAMLPSANEASNGIAEHISGSIPNFVSLMNQRAVQAGALHTNFTNANGLCAAKHVTTAYDMAMITRTALLNDQFRRIFGTLKYDIPPTNKQPETRHLYAEHKMLVNGRYEYDGVIGGKTGYTQESQNTLVTAARRGDRELIVVVIKSQNSGVYTDTKTLLDYGFNDFSEVQIILPAVTAENMANPKGTLEAAENIVNQNQAEKYTRLIHNSVDRNEITIDYTAAADTTGDDDTLTMNMRLKNPTDFMYANLGSITLPASPSGSNWLARVLTAVVFVVKMIASITIFLLALRLFFTTRTKMRKKLRASRASRARSMTIKYDKTNG